MKNTKLIEVLKQLDSRERSRFEEFVHSPFINKNRKVQRLCQYVLGFAPKYEAKGLDRKKAFVYAFEEKKYRELSFNNVSSDLLQLLYQFLAFQAFQEAELLQKKFQMQSLLKRELHDHVSRLGRRFQQIQNKNSFRTHSYYWHQYQLFDQLDQLSLTKGKRGYDENLQHKSDQLDLFYLIDKLRIACDMTSRNIVVNAGYECHLLPQIEEYLNQNSAHFQAHPALLIYYTTLQMLRSDPSGQHYQQLVFLLEQQMSIFPPNELRVIYNYALNYCVRQINFGKSEYYREILSLYKILLREKIIFKNGHLSQWSYINIIAAGIRLKEYDWTEDFIHTYREYLVPEVQHNVYAYNLAVLYFEQQKYSEALSKLMDVEFTDAFFYMAAKLIQLKCYYHVDATEAFFSLSESARKYISRNRQLSDYHKKSYQHFFKMATRVYQLSLKSGIIKHPKFEEERQKLQEQLQDLEPLANRNWLQRILAEA